MLDYTKTLRPGDICIVTGNSAYHDVDINTEVTINGRTHGSKYYCEDRSGVIYVLNRVNLGLLMEPIVGDIYRNSRNLKKCKLIGISTDIMTYLVVDLDNNTFLYWLSRYELLQLEEDVHEVEEVDVTEKLFEEMIKMKK